GRAADHGANRLAEEVRRTTPRADAVVRTRRAARYAGGRAVVALVGGTREAGNPTGAARTLGVVGARGPSVRAGLAAPAAADRTDRTRRIRAIGVRAARHHPGPGVAGIAHAPLARMPDRAAERAVGGERLGPRAGRVGEVDRRRRQHARARPAVEAGIAEVIVRRGAVDV